MENSSIFWEKIIGLFESIGLSDLTQTKAILILLSVLIVLLLLLWLIIRRARLWYWKTDVQIDTLKSIDLHLKNVEEKLSSEIRIAESQDAQPQDDQMIQIAQENEKITEIKEGLTAIGKSGRIYTEAELELQIRE